MCESDLFHLKKYGVCIHILDLLYVVSVFHMLDSLYVLMHVSFDDCI